MGDEAFEEIWNRYYSRIAYYVGRMFPSLRDEAEDLVQETFARAFAAFGARDAAAPVAPWLYAIARNLCVDRLRRAGRRGGPEAVLEEAAAENADPCEQVDRDQRRRAVGEAIRGLPPRDREICYLYYFENLSVREIGRLTGRPAGTVKYRLFRIRDQLRERMEDRFEG